MYEVKTENVYDDFSKIKRMFDISNYSAKSNYYNDSNALVIGKMKDEMRGVFYWRICCIKAKNVLDSSAWFYWIWKRKRCK